MLINYLKMKESRKTEIPWITLTKGQTVVDSEKRAVSEFNGFCPFCRYRFNSKCYIGRNVNKFVNLKDELDDTSLFADGSVSINTVCIDELEGEELDVNTITFRDIKDINDKAVPTDQDLFE